jgi:hypothetical protein
MNPMQQGETDFDVALHLTLIIDPRITDKRASPVAVSAKADPPLEEMGL